MASYAMVSFRRPRLVRLTANRWRVDVEFRGAAVQRIPLIWTPCHFGGRLVAQVLEVQRSNVEGQSVRCDLDRVG